MIIEKVDPNRASFSDYSLEGNDLNIGGVTIDLAAEEGDQQVIISFGKCNGVIHRGLMPGCTYTAEVIIPPQKYVEVEVEDDEASTTHTDMLPVPLDTNSVILKLWPLIDETMGEVNN
jgi:hypothetical protein